MYTFCIQGEAWTKKTFGLPRKLYSLWQWRQHLSWGLGAEAEMNESQMWICFALKSFFSIPRTKMGVNNPTPAWPRNLWFRDRSSIPCSEMTWEKMTVRTSRPESCVHFQHMWGNPDDTLLSEQPPLCRHQPVSKAKVKLAPELLPVCQSFLPSREYKGALKERVHQKYHQPKYCDFKSFFSAK